MSDDRFPTWDDIDREANARREDAWRNQPWRFSARPEDVMGTGRTVAPVFPKGYPVYSTCSGCPLARCNPCPWDQAWQAEEARRNPTPSPSWWRRITARLRGGDNQ